MHFLDGEASWFSGVMTITYLSYNVIRFGLLSLLILWQNYPTGTHIWNLRSTVPNSFDFTFFQYIL